MKDLIIFGSGGHARSVIAVAKINKKWNRFFGTSVTKPAGRHHLAGSKAPTLITIHVLHSFKLTFKIITR